MIFFKIVILPLEGQLEAASSAYFDQTGRPLWGDLGASGKAKIDLEVLEQALGTVGVGKEYTE